MFVTDGAYEAEIAGLKSELNRLRNRRSVRAALAVARLARPLVLTWHSMRKLVKGSSPLGLHQSEFLDGHARPQQSESGELDRETDRMFQLLINARRGS